MLEIIESEGAIEINGRDNIFIDRINKLILLEQSNSFPKGSTFRFNEVSHIDYSYKSGTDPSGDSADIYNIHIILISKDPIWVCTFYNKEIKSRELANRLSIILETKMYPEMDDKYKKTCPQCKRMISKISKHCIYCGIKTNA